MMVRRGWLEQNGAIRVVRILSSSRMHIFSHLVC